MKGLAVAIATTLGLAGAATAQDGEPIVWSVHVDLSGPASYGGIPQGDGFESYVEWRNAQGGINGRPIDLTVTDTTFSVDVAAGNFRRAMAQGDVSFLFGDSTGMMQAISPENNREHRVLTGAGSFASELADPERFPYYFVAGATYGDQLRLLVQHIAETENVEEVRLAIMHSTISLGRDGIEDAREEAEALGIEIVEIQQSNFVEADVSTFALGLRAARPTHLIFHGYSFAVWPETIRLMQDFGMGDITFMTTMWQNEHEKLEELIDVADGLVMIKVFETDTNLGEGEMIDVIEQIHMERDPDFDGNVRLGFMDGWFNAMMAAQATEDVLNTGLELTGDNLVAALEALEDWDTGGLIGIPVDFSGHEVGVGQVIQWNVAEDGTLSSEAISDWIEVE
jgi:branched-chain amino acid transport system substrate-binding protein